MDRGGKTALHYAAANEHGGEGSEGMHEWLLQLGADKEHEDNVTNKDIFIFILMSYFMKNIKLFEKLYIYSFLLFLI